MKTKRKVNHTFIAMMTTIMAIGVLILVIFSPEVPTATRFIFIAAFLGFGWLLLWSQLIRHFQQFLGRAMSATSSRTETASGLNEEPLMRVESRGVPPRPFRYQVLHVNSTFELSPRAERLRKQSYEFYHQYVLNLVIGALFLWISLLVLSSASALLVREAYLSFGTLCGSVLLLLIAFFLAAPRRYLTTFTFSVWSGLNVIFFASVVYLAVTHLMRGPVGTAGFGRLVVFGLAVGVIVVYGVLFFLLAAILRRQVAANKPCHLLFLWVFNSGINVKSTMIGLRSIWRFLGTMQFLRGGDLTVDMGDLVRKEREELVVDRPDELERALKAFRYAPNWLGMYAQNTLLCGDAVWKSAVHAFLRNADVVVMNLFGFSPSNQGCLYELGLLVDTIPIQRMLFLIDETTDLDFLLATLTQNWNTMSLASPNYKDIPASVQIYQMGNVLERLSKKELPRPGVHPLQPFLSLLTTAQAESARETDAMLRLILEGIVC